VFVVDQAILDLKPQPLLTLAGGAAATFTAHSAADASTFAGTDSRAQLTAPGGYAAGVAAFSRRRKLEPWASATGAAFWGRSAYYYSYAGGGLAEPDMTDGEYFARKRTSITHFPGSKQMQCHAVPCSSMQGSAVPCSSVQCRAMQSNAKRMSESLAGFR
jgi:hypothetical protein